MAKRILPTSFFLMNSTNVSTVTISCVHSITARSISTITISCVYNQSINQSIFIVKTLLTERSGVTDKHGKKTTLKKRHEH